MVDTPVAVISREPERVKVSLYNIVYVLNNMYHASMAELFLVIYIITM